MGAIAVAHPAAASPPSSGDCLAGATFRTVHTARITDGDSLLLDDGRRVRLIGINALELHSSDEQDRRLARQARDTLQDFLTEQQILITPGLEAQDGYGRTLAHVRLSDGRDAAHTLVAKGLALAVAIGPNTRCASRLQMLERRARERRLGLWQSPGHWYTDKKLSGREQGFHVLSAKVIDVSGRGARTTLHLSNGLQVMLGRHWPEPDGTQTLVPQRLSGSKVQVRGWLNSVDGQLRMTLNHPDNLELISN